MEFRELMGLGKELRALLIPVFVGMRLGKELEFSLGWFLGKFRLPDPADSRFFLWKLPWKSWEENPTGSWNGSGGKSLGAHPIPWAIPAHPNPIPAAFPWSCRWNSGRKRALGVGNCSFPAHSQPFSRELLIPSPYPWIWRFPGSLCPLEDIPDPLEFSRFPTPKIPSLGPFPSPGIP